MSRGIWKVVETSIEKTRKERREKITKKQKNGEK